MTRLLDEKAELLELLNARLRAEILKCVDDPLRFAELAFPWGEGELSAWGGPNEWQREVLESVRDGLSWEAAYQDATASGHGVGKSALLAILILWAMLDPNCRGTVTANTGEQLRTKTWPELSKWYRLCRVSDLWELTATTLKTRNPECRGRVDAVTWSEENPAAFAGLHNVGSRIILVMDEASEIAPVIWETAEGALTDAGTQILWFAFGNRTQPVGRFNDCFGRFRARWRVRCIDSRTVPQSNKAKIAQWAEDYGEDSDFFRVRVLGLAPAVAAQALIGPEEVEVAFNRVYKGPEFEFAAIILGVDVARQGDDETVIYARQGLQARPPKCLRVPDCTLVAAHVAQVKLEVDANALMVDGTGGYGAGVVDCLRSTGHTVTEVQFAGRPNDPRYFNKRSEMWMLMRNWIKSGGAIPRDEALKEELCAATYQFRGDKFQLCEKQDVKDVIGRSPDRADALALTFAMPVANRLFEAHDLLGRETRAKYDVDRDPFN